MKLASICGLGQFAHSPITSVMKHFPEVMKRTSPRTSLSGRRLLPMRGTYEFRSSAPDDQLTIDGMAITVPSGHDGFRRGAPPGHRDPDALPSAERNTRRRVPGVRGRSRRTRPERVLHSAGRSRHDGRTPIPTRSQRARRTLLELLMADHPVAVRTPAAFGRLRAGDAGSRRKDRGVAFRAALSPRGQDDSSLVIAVDHEACILCDRCIRGCDEIRDNT